MGGKICCKSKSEELKLSTYSEPVEDFEPDPITGLTKEEMQLLRKTWAYMESKDLVLYVGAETFITLFDDYPYMMIFFENFGLKKKGPRVNEKVRTHAITFMTAVQGLVDFIDKPDSLIDLLGAITESHIKRKVTVGDMQRITATFLKVLKINLTTAYSEEEQKAWRKFFTFINISFVAAWEAHSSSV